MRQSVRSLSVGSRARVAQGERVCSQGPRGGSARCVRARVRECACARVRVVAPR